MRMFLHKKRKIKRIIALFLVCAVLIVLVIRGANLFFSLAQAKARLEASYAINNIISEYSANNLYSEIIIKEYDSAGNITAVSTDIAFINRLQGEISTRLLEKLRENTQYYITLSFANILGMRTISAFGPKIPVKIAPSPNITVKFEDSLVSAGINQTKFTVNLKIEVDMLVSTSPLKSNVKVNHEMPVVQVVLVGQVPTTYADFDGNSIVE